MAGGNLDPLLAGVRRIAQDGAMLATGSPPAIVLNVVSPLTATLNATTGHVDLTSPGGGGGGGGQFVTSVTNGANNNVPTSGLQTLLLGGPTAAYSITGFRPASGAPAAGSLLFVKASVNQPLTFAHLSGASTYPIFTQTGRPVTLPLGGNATALFMFNGQTGAMYWELLTSGLELPGYTSHITRFGADPTGALDCSTSGPGGTDSLDAWLLSLGTGGSGFVVPGTYKHSLPLRLDAARGLKGVHLFSTSLGQDGPWQATFSFIGTPLSGTAATIASLAAGPPAIMSLTGIPGLTSLNIGDTLTLSNCATAGNNCSMTILTVNVGGSGHVTAYANNLDEFTAVTQSSATEANNGSIHWTVRAPQVRLYSRGCSFANLAFYGNGNAGAVFDGSPDVGGGTNTANKFYNCLITGGSAGVAGPFSAYGVKIGDIGQNGGAYGGNCDLYTFVKCNFGFLSHSAINIPNTTGNSKSHRIVDPVFNDAGGLSTMLYGVWVNRGSFYCDGAVGEFIGVLGGGNNAGAIFMVFGNGEPVDIRNTNYEHCVRLGRFSQGGTTPQFVNIDGVRAGISAAEIASDGFVITALAPTGLRVRGADFNGGGASLNAAIFLGGGSTSQGIAADISACTFARTDSHIAQTGNTGNCYWSSGNVWGASGTINLVTDGERRSWRTDGVQYVTYPAVPIESQAQKLAEFYTSTSAWPAGTLVNGVNHDLPALPNTSCGVTTPTGLTGAFALGGIKPPAQNPGGMQHRLLNLTAFPMTLTHQDTGSSAANRLISPTGFDILNVAWAEIEYRADATTPGWYILNYCQSGKGIVSGGTLSGLTGTGTTVTLTTNQAGADLLMLQGTLTSNQTFVVPNIAGWSAEFSIRDLVMGSFSLSFTAGSGTATIPLIDISWNVIEVTVPAVNGVPVIDA